MFCCSGPSSSSSKPAIFACFVVNSIPTVLAVIGVLGLLHQHHIVNLQGLNSLSQGASIALLTTGSFFISLQLLALYKLNSRSNLPALSDPTEFQEEIKKFQPRFMRMVSEGVFEEEIIDTDKITEDLQKSQADQFRKELDKSKKSSENALIEQTKKELRANKKIPGLVIPTSASPDTLFVAQFTNDLFFVIFRQLDQNDLKNVAQVCKKFKGIVSEMRRIKTSRETPIVSSGSQRSIMGNVPTELFLEILKYLDGDDLKRTALVCKKFTLIVKEEIKLQDKVKETFVSEAILRMTWIAFGCSESYSANYGGARIWIKPDGKLLAISGHDQPIVFFNKNEAPSKYPQYSDMPKDTYIFDLSFPLHDRKTKMPPNPLFSMEEAFLVWPKPPKSILPEKVDKTVKYIESGVTKKATKKMEELPLAKISTDEKYQYYTSDYPWGLFRMHKA